MVRNAFEQVLKEMGDRLGCELQPDSKGCCLVTLPEGVQVQFDLGTRGRRLIMGTMLGALPVGKYREHLFRAALQTNHATPPHVGVIAYSAQKEVLVLIAMLDLEELTGDKVLDFLGPFAMKAHEWFLAIENGEVPAVAGVSGPQKPSTGLFGLRP